MAIANNQLRVKNRNGTLVEPEKGYFYNGVSRLTYTSVLDDDGWTTFTFNKDLLEIRDDVFINKSLTDVQFPDCLTYIGSSAFEGNILNALVLPSGLTRIGYGAFENAGIYGAVVIPSGVTEINKYAFTLCNMTEVLLPDGLVYIGDCVFERCSYLERVDFPSVTQMGAGVFAYCVALETIALPVGATNAGFAGCTSLVDVHLPDTITSVSFKGCTSLVDVQLPDSVTSVSFKGCTSLVKLRLPDSLTEIGANAFEDCTKLEIINIPDGVTRIGYRAFAICTSLKVCDLPAGLERIDDDAFAGAGLLNVTVPENVSYVGSGTFRAMDRLVSVTWNAGDMPDRTFYCCDKLRTVKIGDGCTKILQNVFGNCRNLYSIEIGTGCTMIGPKVFQFCESLKKIICHAATAPSVYNDSTFTAVRQNGTLYHPKGTDYSAWLLYTNKNLLYWNDVYIGGLEVDMPSDVVEGKDYRITITYPNGGELTISSSMFGTTYEDIIITIDSETDNGNGTTTAIGTLRVNEEFEQSSAFITISDGTDRIQEIINITEATDEPPMAIPTISINRYADLAFPAEGGTKYITITYTNTQVSLINKPYSTAIDTTITPQTTTEFDNGVEIYYAVTVTANSYERDIPLIFSCSNAQGESTTETFTGMQAGESPNTGDAYINLDYTQHQFPASGGTFDVLATYSYPVSGKSLSVTVRNATVNTNISWCKAELIGGQIDDDWTEGNETWKITMNPGLDNTEPMSARIIFSYTDSRGGTAVAEFIATREAGTTTGTTSSLSVYRTQMRFTADGEFSFNDPTCTVNYQYTNEEDIEDPVVEGDWIVVTEGEHRTNAGQILIDWNVAVARNLTPTSRTGSITFRSIGQDDVEREGVCVVIQDGAEDVEETFEWVDLLWKDNAVTLEGDDVTFRILDGYDEVYTGRIQKRPGADTNWFFINKIVQDYIYMEEIPDLLDGTADTQKHENGYKTFRLDSPDNVGAMKSYMFKYDWSYTESSPFVLSESIIPYVVEGQKNLITYCNLDYYGAYTDVYTWIKNDGNLENGAITAEPEEYATKVVKMPENARYYVLSGQKYEVVSPCQVKYVLYYLSPKGGWCWFPIMGKVEVSDRLTSFTLSSNYDNTTSQFGKKRYTVDIATDYNISTGFLTETQSLRMWEMLESNMVYLHDMEKDVVFPVVMKQDTVEKKRYQRGQTKMLSYSFGVETSQGRMRI